MNCPPTPHTPHPSTPASPCKALPALCSLGVGLGEGVKDWSESRASGSRTKHPHGSVRRRRSAPPGQEGAPAGADSRRRVQSEESIEQPRPLRQRGVSACVRPPWPGWGLSWRLLFVLQLSSRTSGTSGKPVRRTAAVCGGHAASTGGKRCWSLWGFCAEHFITSGREAGTSLRCVRLSSEFFPFNEENDKHLDPEPADDPVRVCGRGVARLSLESFLLSSVSGFGGDHSSDARHTNGFSGVAASHYPLRALNENQGLLFTSHVCDE